MKGEEFTRFLAVMRAYAEKAFVESMAAADTGGQFMIAVEAKKEKLAEAIKDVEKCRKGWRTGVNRRRWIDKYQRIGVAAFDARIIELVEQAALSGGPIKGLDPEAMQ
jgi:hypothetical protein